MRCQCCGYENQPGQNRCAGCGKPITGERTPQRKNMVLFGVVLLLIGLVAGILIGGSFRKEPEIGCGGIPIVTEILPAETDAETLPTQPETDNYRGWKLQKLYPGEEGVVGLTLDGKLVGDGIYENTDFSAFVG